MAQRPDQFFDHTGFSAGTGTDFVVPIGTDQHEVTQIRPSQQVLEQIERSRIQPLQIVKEERERMLRPDEEAD
jgi:hypothetical protein